MDEEDKRLAASHSEYRIGIGDYCFMEQELERFLAERDRQKIKGVKMNDFETHISKVFNFDIDIGIDGEYESNFTREHWLTWQAALEKSQRDAERCREMQSLISER